MKELKEIFPNDEDIQKAIENKAIEFLKAKGLKKGQKINIESFKFGIEWCKYIIEKKNEDINKMDSK